MSDLQGIGRFKFHEGELEEFKRSAAQCMEIVRAKDTGTLQYDIYLNDDQSECIVLERYRDSDALIEHAAHLRQRSSSLHALPIDVKSVCRCIDANRSSAVPGVPLDVRQLRAQSYFPMGR
jgi:quinol monooxygenase YgiN